MPQVLLESTQQHWCGCILYQRSKATPGPQAKQAGLVMLRENHTCQAPCLPQVCASFHPWLSWRGTWSNTRYLAAWHLALHPARRWLHRHLPTSSEGFWSTCHVPRCSGLASLLRSWGCLNPSTEGVKSTPLHSSASPTTLQGWQKTCSPSWGLSVIPNASQLCPVNQKKAGWSERVRAAPVLPGPIPCVTVPGGEGKVDPDQ